MAGSHDLRQARVGGILLGVGMGGFVDGIVLHQILQRHNMLSSVLPPSTLEAMHTNMLWDGPLPCSGMDSDIAWHFHDLACRAAFCIARDQMAHRLDADRLGWVQFFRRAH